jgi:hypothetical protein
MAIEPTTDLLKTPRLWGSWAHADPAALTCAECSSEMPPEAVFCGECGVRLEHPAEADVAESTEPDLDPADDEIEPATNADAGADVEFELDEPTIADPDLTPEPTRWLPAVPPPPPTAGGPPRRRRTLVLVGMAAAIAILAGVVVSAARSGNDESVTAADASTTTVAEPDRASDDEADRRPETAVDPPAPDAAAPTEDDATTETTLAGGQSSAGLAWAPLPTEQTGGPAPAQPNTGSTPAAPAPPPPPTTTAPPPPAALSASSSCSSPCVITRGSMFTISVTNTGGRSGNFTVTVSRGVQASPAQGSVPPGQTRTINVADMTGQRRNGETVEVRVLNGPVIFSATFDVRG